MALPTYQEKMRERLARVERKEQESEQARHAHEEAIRAMWTQPAFKALLERWDRRYDPATLLAVDPTQPGWEAQFIGLRKGILDYWQERTRMERIVKGEPDVA
jgi:hypothetical protein